MQGDKISEMKKRLAACLSKINPDLDIDTRNAADWQQTFTVFKKELLGVVVVQRNPCSQYWLVLCLN